MTKRDILIFLFKWYRVILLVLLSVVAFSAVIQYFSPQPFTAKAMLMVEHTRSPTSISEFAPGLQSTDVINTEVNIFLSQTVISKAVDTVKPHERPEKPGFIKDLKKDFKAKLVELGLSDKSTKRDNWIRYLSKNITAKGIVGSNIIQISYTDENPNWSADMVNALVHNYLDHRLEVYAPEGKADVYKNQMDLILAQLNQHLEELDALNQSDDINAVNERRKSLLQQRSLLLERISASEVELADLKLKYDPKHDRVKSVVGRINSYRSEVAELDKLVEEVDLRLVSTADLRLNIEAEEALYQTYKRRYDEERLNAMTNSDLVNVRVVDFAKPAVRADHSRLFYIVLTSIGGLFFAFGIAFLLEYFDRRITNGAIAEEILHVPNLGAIPRK